MAVVGEVLVGARGGFGAVVPAFGGGAGARLHAPYARKHPWLHFTTVEFCDASKAAVGVRHRDFVFKPY